MNRLQVSGCSWEAILRRGSGSPDEVLKIFSWWTEPLEPMLHKCFVTPDRGVAYLLCKESRFPPMLLLNQ
jgi:hypothetical protein